MSWSERDVWSWSERDVWSWSERDVWTDLASQTSSQQTGNQMRKKRKALI